MLSLTVPAGVGPGEQFLALTPEGHEISVTVPPGAFSGQMIQVQPPVPVAMAQPVAMAHPPVVVLPSVPPPTTLIVQHEAVDMHVSRMQPTGVDAVSEGKIVLWHGCCCSHCGLYLTPDCYGCSQKAGCLCLTCEACCKPNTAPLCCCCCELSCCTECVLAKRQLQCCCFAETCAIPCDDEVCSTSTAPMATAHTLLRPWVTRKTSNTCWSATSPTLCLSGCRMPQVPCVIAACGIACFPKCVAFVTLYTERSQPRLAPRQRFVRFKVSAKVLEAISLLGRQALRKCRALSGRSVCSWVRLPPPVHTQVRLLLHSRGADRCEAEGV